MPPLAITINIVLSLSAIIRNNIIVLFLTKGIFFNNKESVDEK